MYNEWQHCMSQQPLLFTILVLFLGTFTILTVVSCRLISFCYIIWNDIHLFTHLFVWSKRHNNKDLIAASDLAMASYGVFRWKTAFVTLLAVFLSGAYGADIFLEWVVEVDTTINPFTSSQPVSNEVTHLLHFIIKECLCFTLLKVCKNIVAYR